MCALVGYFDGSGSHAGSAMRTLCGFLGDVDAWLTFEDRWNTVLNKPRWPNRPKELHMYDCAHGCGDFEGWVFAERLALVGDLVQVVEDTKGILAIGSGASISIFQALTPADLELLKSERLGTSIDLVFQFCMQQITYWAKTMWPGEQAAVIFDADNGPEDLLYHEHFNYYVSDHQKT